MNDVEVVTIYVWFLKVLPHPNDKMNGMKIDEKSGRKNGME